MSITEAVENLIEQFNITKPWEQATKGMTCNEVDALARLHEAAGDHKGAVEWLIAHAEYDTNEDGDQHQNLGYDDAAGSWDTGRERAALYLESGYDHAADTKEADEDGEFVCGTCGEPTHFYGSNPQWMHNDDTRNS